MKGRAWPRLSAATVLALVLLVAVGAPAPATGDHDHADHNQPGSPLATPVSSNARLVDSDGGASGGHVVVEGDRLYVGAYGVGMRIFDISNPADPVQIGGYLPGNRADAVPDAAIYGDRHIAALNGTRRNTLTNDTRTDRSEFLDVTDAANPVLLHEFVGQEHGEAHNGDIVDERRLWLPSGGTGVGGDGRWGLRIYDISPLIETPTEQCTPRQASNPCSPVRLFNGNPVAMWEESPFRQGRPVGATFTHTHDITVYLDHPVLQPDGTFQPRDIILLAEGGNYIDDSTNYGASSGNTGSAFVIDITDPQNPVVLLRWLHERGPNHHPIRYHHEAQFLEGDPHVMLVTDEDLHHPCGDGDGGPVDLAGGGTTAVRLSADLTQATELSEWFIPAATPAPVCSAHVFSSHGNLVFNGSYNAGLQIMDYTDPSAPTQHGFFIAPGSTAWGAQYHQGYVYVGDMSRGLDTFAFDAPDLALASEDITLSSAKVNGGDEVTITAAVRNIGTQGASNVAVRFEDNGVLIGDSTIAVVPAGGSGQAQATWSTKHLKGDRTITVTADPANAIAEIVETNNSASETVEVRGNQVRNSSFETSSNGTAPDDWSSSGDTAYVQGGSDGERAVTAGPGGVWISESIPVQAGATYEVAVDVSGAGGTLVVEQLSSTGAVVASVSALLPSTGLFDTVTDSVTIAAGASEVRIRLIGGLVGTTTFDNVGLWEA